MFEDVDEEFQLVSVLRRHADWAASHSNSFQECFIADFIPKLIEPYVRLELIRFWFDLDSVDVRDVDDIRQLLITQRWFIHISKLTELDSDSSASRAFSSCFDKLLSDSLEQLFISSLQRLVDVWFEPHSSTHSRKLACLLECVLDRLGCNAHAKPCEVFFDTLLARFRRSVDEVFIPVLVNKSVANDDRLRVHYAFLQRQFWSAAKLFANVLSLARFVDASRTQSLIVDTLLNRYVMMAFQLLDVTPSGDLQERLDFIVSRLPRNWLDSSSANKLSDAQRQPLVKFVSGLFETCKNDKNSQKLLLKLLLKLGAEIQAAEFCSKFAL